MSDYEYNAAAVDNDEVYESFDDLPDDTPIPAGTYNLTVTDVKYFKDDSGFVERAVISFEVADGEHKGAGVEDNIRRSNTWDYKRFRSFARVAGKKTDRGVDLSPGTVIGKVVTAFVKFDSFNDCNAPRRYSRTVEASETVPF